MAFQIAWTAPAQADLKAVWDYISRENPKAADRLRNEILKLVGMLSLTPRLGHRFAGRVRGEIRELVIGNYRVFYEVIEQEHRIHILVVRHASRREPKSADFKRADDSAEA